MLWTGFFRASTGTFNVRILHGRVDCCTDGTAAVHGVHGVLGCEASLDGTTPFAARPDCSHSLTDGVYIGIDRAGAKRPCIMHCTHFSLGCCIENKEHLKEKQTH